MHPRAARCGDGEQRQPMLDRVLGGGDKGAAHRARHAAGHEGEIHGEYCDFEAVDGAFDHAVGVGVVGFGAGFFEAFAILFAVFEFQGVIGGGGHGDGFLAVVIQQMRQAGGDIPLQMVVAVGAAEEVIRKVGLIDQALAGGAFFPDIGRDFALGGGFDAGAHEVAEEGHCCFMP